MTNPSGSRRAVWIAVGAVLAAALVVTVVLVAQEGDEGGENESGRALTKPRRAAGYTLDRSAPARRYSRTTQRDLQAQVPGAGVVVGTYAKGEEQLVFVGYSFPPASEQGEALAASAPDALFDYLDSAGVEDMESYDAGPLGGALICGRLRSGAGSPQVTCGWAADGILGTLRFATGPLTDGPAGDAAEVTADFRAAVEPVG